MEYTREYLESIEEAMKDEEFAASIGEAKSSDEVIRLFAQKDIILDQAIADACIEKMKKVAENGNELEIEDLEAVSGGGAFTSIIGSAALGGVLVAGGVLSAPAAILVGSAVGIYGIVSSSTKKKR